MKSELKSISRLKLLSLCLLMCAPLMSMSGCSTTPQREPSVGYQANMMRTCPEQLPRLKGNTGNDFDAALRQCVAQYIDCAPRHNQLVKEIKLREAIK